MSSSESGNDGDVALSKRFEDLRGKVKGRWNTQAEATLLAALEQLHTRFMKRSAQSYQKVEKLSIRTTAAHVTLANTFNALKLLSQQQFVQHRIATEDLQLRQEQRKMEQGPDSDEGEDQEEGENAAVSFSRPYGYQQRAKKQAILRRMHAYVEARRDALVEEGVRVPLCPGDVEELADENPYHRRRLCGLIGTASFLRDARIGCAEKRGGEADGKARIAALSPSAQPAYSVGTAASAIPSTSAVPMTVPAVPSQVPLKGGEPSTVHAMPAQTVSPPAATVTPPPGKSLVPRFIKSVVPPPKPAAVPPPAKTMAVQRVAVKQKRRQALFSSSSSSASSLGSPSPPPAPEPQKTAQEKNLKQKKEPAKRTGKNLFGSSSSSTSASDVETSSSLDSSTLSSTTSDDVPAAAVKAKSKGEGVSSAFRLPPPPLPSSAERPPTSSFAPTNEAAPLSPAAHPPPLPPESNAPKYAMTAEQEEPKAASASASSASPVPLSQSPASSALPPPPLVFSFDGDSVLTAAPRVPPATASPPAPPSPPLVSSATATILPIRGGKLLSTSSDEDE